MRLICSGCDAPISAEKVLAFSCPNRDTDNRDHVLRFEMSKDEIRAGWPAHPLELSDNPFIRYRKLSYSWHLAMHHGLRDVDYVEVVTSLSESIAAVDRSVQITPLTWNDALGVAIKNETINVSGSHKARHLIGTAIHMAVVDRIDHKASDSTIARRDIVLAIASCGNAALAAAVVAKATGYRLKVFVPPSASQNIVDHLHALGAEQVVCERRDSDPPGDPCYLRFRKAVAAGALPFSCQGGDNALALIGGHTLGWEIIEQLQGLEGKPIQQLFIQVGGGALASSIMQAFTMAESAGVLPSLPTFYAVQTEGACPLMRAWQQLTQGEGDLQHARSHRSEYMWPWESVPQSIASGILDDETYDWYSILTGLEQSHGSVITVSEKWLKTALASGQKNSDISVDATGVSGFAGFLATQDSIPNPAGSRSLVLFTGAIR